MACGEQYVERIGILRMQKLCVVCLTYHQRQQLRSGQHSVKAEVQYGLTTSVVLETRAQYLRAVIADWDVITVDTI